MVHIQIEPHANGIGGHKVIHIAVLIHFNLRIARPWAQSPHDHGRPALLAPQKFSNSIDIIDAERDNGRAFRHAADFLLPAVAQLRKPLPMHKIRSRNQSRNGLSHGLCTHKERFMQAARAQQTIREHMAALRIGAELDLIYREKVTPHALGHGLNGTDPIFRARRHNALLAGHQSHNGRPPQRYDFVINLACQQSQGQSHDSRAMRQHPFNGIMGFARVGRA